jgi:hypothetical protein
MDIGERVPSEVKEHVRRRILAWSSVTGIALFATGAGDIFYLAVTDFDPEAEFHPYWQSAALAVGLSFLGIRVLSELTRWAGPYCAPPSRCS